MDTSSYIDTILQDPRIKGTIYEAMYRQLSSKKDPRLYVPQNNTTNPYVNTYLGLEDKNNKYYKEQTAAETKKANQEGEFTSQDYQTTVNELNRSLEEDKNQLADTEGKQGTWASSARADRLGSLSSKYQNQFASAYNQAKKAAEINSVNNQWLLGANNFYSPAFNSYSVNPGGQVSQSGTYQYNPFAQRSGSIKANNVYSNLSIQ